MKSRSFLEYHYPIFDEIEICFSAFGAHVFTIPFVARECPFNGSSYEFPPDEQPLSTLVIQLGGEVDLIDAAHEASRYARPKIIGLLSILTYFLGYSIVIQDKFRSQSFKGPLVSTGSSSIKNNSVCTFVIRGADRSEELDTMLKAFDEEGGRGKLLLSLLDRWRKGYCLRFNIDQDENFADESILAFFHVMERLAEYCSHEIKSDAEAKIDAFCTSLYKDTYHFSGGHLESVIGERKKALKSLLMGHEISVASKLAHLLLKIGLHSDRTMAAIKWMIDSRNTIAHGKTEYPEAVVWPLPAFFRLIPEYEVLLSLLCVLSARVIGAWLGIDAWKEEWESLSMELPTPAERVGRMLRQGWLDQPNIDELMTVNPNCILKKWLTTRSSHRKLDALERALLPYFENDEYSGQQAHRLFHAAVCLADSTDHEVASRCRRFVREFHFDDDHRLYTNVKDPLRELELKEHHPKWFRQWIEAGGHCSTQRRCAGITKKGTRCRKGAQPGRLYCSLHESQSGLSKGSS